MKTIAFKSRTIHILRPKTRPQKRYEGKKAKLIHLEKDTFTILDTIAKKKGLTLKKYIELFCFAQAKYEAKLFMEQYQKQQAKQ